MDSRSGLCTTGHDMSRDLRKQTPFIVQFQATALGQQNGPFLKLQSLAIISKDGSKVRFS